MIPKGDGTKVNSRIQGESIEMRLHAAGLAHIMETLSNLYSDREMAVLREISTNAYDSHIQAGNKRPIEVTLPSGLSTTLVIRDYGVGLDVDDIREIYSQYGASTKRETNDLSGVLGLGSKSPLTYCDQFTFVGIKDGIKTTVSVGRKDAGKPPTMTVVSEKKTDEHNGVEVKIPVERNNGFAQKADQLFKFWPDGSVLVNNRPVEKVVGTEIEPGVIVTDQVLNDYVVMGNVPYRVANSHSLSDRMRGNVVAWVDMGDVEFVPSREDLKYTEDTDKALKQIRSNVKAKIQAVGLEQVQKSTSPREAIKALMKWENDIGMRLDHATFRGKDFPRDRWEWKDVNGQSWLTDESLKMTSIGSYREATCTNTWSIRISESFDALFVEDFSPSKMTVAHKRKVQLWMEENNIEAYQGKKIIFVPRGWPAVREWLGDEQFVSYPENIKKIKLPSVGESNIRKVAGSYNCWVNGTYRFEMQADLIDTENPIFFSDTTMQGPLRKVVADLITENYPNCTIVEMSSNRIKKFKRDFPTAKLYKEAGKEMVDTLWKAIPLEDLESQRLQAKSSMLRKLNPQKIDDPALRRAVEVARKPKISEKIDKYAKLTNLLNLHAEYAKLEDVKVDNPLEKYPLIEESHRSYYAEIHTHTYHYINHINALRAEGQKV